MSELRQDLVSGDWIIVAPERLSRPHDFVSDKKPRKKTPKNKCPFENLGQAESWAPILSFPNKKNWEIIIIPNKYPALVHSEACATSFGRGPYKLCAGVGYHDLVITRDHDKNFADLSAGRALDLMKVFQKRYKAVSVDPCILYTSAFFNWGPKAGASIYHPHYQVVSLPIVPPDVQHSLTGSDKYFKKHRRCAHCEMLKYELKEKVRIIEENAGAVAFAPFFSRQPFEVRIFTKAHLPHFEKTPASDLKYVTLIMQNAIRRIRKHLNDADFNFFVHTAPFRDKGKYDHYHWHIEVIPKIAITAGFELSTGVEINVIDPNRAAEVLRRKVSG